MPDFINKVSYINTAGNEIELDQTTAVTTVGENTLSVSHADTAGTADLAIVANSATNIKNKAGNNVPLASALLDMVYPVGSIYMSVNNVSPQSFLGGTWVAWGAGKVPVGFASGDGDFGTVEKTGGEKAHQLVNNELPSHAHGQNIRYNGSTRAYSYQSSGSHTATGYTISDSSLTTISREPNQLFTSPVGNNSSHNNLQPYIVCYMWKRTA